MQMQRMTDPLVSGRDSQLDVRQTVQGPRVAVIGAGVSGIVTAKELKEVGVACDVYEMMPVIGGAFAHYGYEGGKLTSSSVFTWFSDFPIEDRQKHMDWTEWLEYLESYIDNFKIRDRFHFNCKVTEAKRMSAKGGWEISVHRKNWSNGHSSHRTAHSQVVDKEATFTKDYDVVIFGSGLHNTPRIPNWDGEDSFKQAGGTILHSSSFRNGADYKGKKVVVIGAGESGSDIAWLTSQHASKVHVSIRTPPGTLYPRFVNGDTADIRDNRIIYSLPRASAPLIRSAHWNFYTNLIRETDKTVRDEFRWAADCNFENFNTIFTINACKSFGIPAAVIRNQAETHPAIARFDGRTVVFTDGASVDDVDAVIAATGYQRAVPALADKELAARFADPRSLWKHMVAPGVDDVFVLGFCRPQQINLVTCCELQARAVAQVLCGAKKLPTKEEMEEEISAWTAHMAATFGRGASSLVDFIPFVDSLAEFIGCAPDLRSLLLSDFSLWIPIMFASFQPAQFRLTGPGAAPALARATIMQTPYHRWRRDRVRRDGLVFVLCMLSAAMGLCGLKRGALVGRAREPLEALVLAGLALLVIAVAMMGWGLA